MGKFIIIYSLMVILFINVKAFASHTFEVEPGVLEMAPSNMHGFVIDHYYEGRGKKTKRWVYFCLKEVKGNTKRCFYGKKSNFSELKRGSLLNGIQYKLKNRVQNKYGQTPLKNSTYFYQATIVRLKMEEITYSKL